MHESVSESDARSALARVDRERRRVIGEFGMPRWYWWSVALGWIALAIVTDMKRPLVTLVATVAFGAAHSTMYHYLAAGRHRTDQLSIRTETVSWYARVAVLACLLALTAAMIVGALLAQSDGARHPVTISSIPVAVTIVLGGPAMMAGVRRSIVRSRTAA